MISTFRFSIKPTGSRTLGSLEYNEKTGLFEQDAAIFIEGVAKLSSPMLINGNEIWDDLPIQLRIRARPPTVFSDPEKRQTQPVEGGEIAEIIRQCIGDFYFFAAYEDLESGIKEPDILSGNVDVSDRMFSDLWQCARTPGCEFQSLYFDVFGEAMQRVKSYGGREFNWTVPAKAYKAVPLHIASFGYWAGQRRPETAK